MNQLETDSHHQPRKNWWQRNWKWFVPTGCFSLILVFALFIFFIFQAVTSVMKESTPYVEAFEKVTTNSYVIENLGEPIEQDGMLQGNISISNGAGEVNISIPLQGPKGEGILYVVGDKYNGEWSYSKMAAFIKSTNETVDLLEE